MLVHLPPSYASSTSSGISAATLAALFPGRRSAGSLARHLRPKGAALQVIAAACLHRPALHIPVRWRHDVHMLTDRVPRRKALSAEFVKSDLLSTLPVPSDDRLQVPARSLASALTAEDMDGVQEACTSFLNAASDFFTVPRPGIQVLSARPRRVREGQWTSELFGDYAPDSFRIRVWMRTAVHKRVTSFGTFFSTLCHEFCHHLDYQHLRFRDSWHTRGFYSRTAILYHYARGTPFKELFWIKAPGGLWRIDWRKFPRGG